MSLYGSRYNIAFGKNDMFMSSFCYSSKFTGNKTRDVSQMFLDQKTIVKKLQKLMLDVKDLETKMFFSKIISYIQQNSSLPNNLLRPRNGNIVRKD